MGGYFIQINPQKKVPYESQIALWAYLIAKGQGQSFEKFIMSEALISQFNGELCDPALRQRMELVLQRNAETVDRLLQAFRAAPWTVVKPVIWNNNLGDDYFIQKLTLSHRFEIYIDCMFQRRGLDIGLYYGRDLQYSGENAAGIEIKRDMRLLETGNLYIEYSEKHDPRSSQWVPSGILKNDNSRFFLLGDFGQFYVLRKAYLQALYQDLMVSRPVPPGVRLVRAGRNTSLGFVIPSALAEEKQVPPEELARFCKRIQ